jgi:hypothetical protein
VTPAVGVHLGIAGQGLGAAALTVAVGQQRRLLDAKALVMAGPLRCEPGAGFEHQPLAAAAGVLALLLWVGWVMLDLKHLQSGFTLP